MLRYSNAGHGVTRPESVGNCRDVGVKEVVALEQQRLAGELGECITEAVAEIQTGRMTALAVAALRERALPALR